VGRLIEIATDELLRSAFDRAPGGISVIGLDGHWLQINKAYCDMLGYEPKDLVGTRFSDVTHPDDVDEDREFMSAAIAGEVDSLVREKRYVCRDGSIVVVNVRAEVVRDDAGKPIYFVSHLRDISERREAQKRLHDSERTLRSIIDNTPALVYVKGRDFRYQLVNREFEETFGVHSDWIVGRSDGDILPASVIEAVRAKDKAVLETGETIQEEETVVRDGQERVFLTVRYPLLDERGQIHAVCVSSTDVTERRHEERSRRERLQCSEQIHSALAQDRFVLYGQPIIDLTSMEVEQAELLIRMRKVRGGDDLALPDEFLPSAERFDLIQLVDEWVVDGAIELAAAGHRVEVNLSAKTISDPGRVDRIERDVLASGAAPGNLIFEITETAAADNLEAARAFAVRLRKLGCAFALDDFGVGHGAFTYLRHLPVDYLKIDIQFVRDLVTNETDRQVVQAIVGVARQFEIETIAEGVESPATLDELRRIGVDYAQGYWIGRPAPLSQLWKSPNNRRGAVHVDRFR
jgi:PAS domain S-box-containing protein